MVTGEYDPLLAVFVYLPKLSVCYFCGYCDAGLLSSCFPGAQPGAAVAIVRLSGPEAVVVAQRVFRPSCSKRALQEPWRPETHRVYHGRLVSETDDMLDEVWPQP